MLSLNSAAALSFNAPVAPVVRSRLSRRRCSARSSSARCRGRARRRSRRRRGLEALAKLNPTVGFYDPLGIVGDDVMPETIGWFRHAEIKHGRVAMAAFVGYCVQANGIHFPWNIQGPFPSGLDTVSFGDISAAGSPADQWDALSTGAKLQILGVVGFLEMWSETSAALEMDGQKHYVRGGKPGYFPTLKGRGAAPAPGAARPLGPLRLHLEDAPPERKEKALLAEVNNGRLAMIGIFGLISASKGSRCDGRPPAAAAIGARAEAHDPPARPNWSDLVLTASPLPPPVVRSRASTRSASRRTRARSWRRSPRRTPRSPSCRACSSRSATSATKRSAISTKGDPVGLRASVETHHCGVVRISG